MHGDGKPSLCHPSHHTGCVPDYSGVLAVPLIVGQAEMAKRVGMSTTWAPVVAIVLGLTLSLGWQGATVIPGAEVWAQAAVWGLALGLTASGLYSGVKKFGEG